jgi:pyrroline-5-carboxylate reductase
MADSDMDWILKSALATQDTAHEAWLRTKPELRPKDARGLTMTFLGCGTMGTAILRGILESLQPAATALAEEDSQEKEAEKKNASSPSSLSRLPSRFNACVRSPRGAKRVREAVDHFNHHHPHHSAPVQIFQNDNVAAVRDADVILLACEPKAVDEVLGVAAEGMREALEGKLLISTLAGVSLQRLHETIYSGRPSPASTAAAASSSSGGDGGGSGSSSHRSSDKNGGDCTIVRAMPNTAAAVRESMTVIVTSDPPLPAPEKAELVEWIFTRIGKTAHLPEASISAATALCGAGPAFCALMAEALAAGAIRTGIPREEAYTMVAQVMRGTTGLLQRGEHPALLRDQVCTPGGATVAGLQVLEEGALRGTISRAVAETAEVAGRLGRKQ